MKIAPKTLPEERIWVRATKENRKFNIHVLALTLIVGLCDSSRREGPIAARFNAYAACDEYLRAG
jgi:hypothetical protein